LDHQLTNGYLRRVKVISRIPLMRCLVACVAVMLLSPGCSRGRGTPERGQLVDHERGFSVVVPSGWSMDVHPDGINLASEEIVGEGYPTLRIEVVRASQLPDDFLSGRSFRWSSGHGSYRNRRWANSLGNGYGLDVDLQGQEIYLTIQAEVWDRRLTRDNRYFRKEFWPIINSLAELM